MTNCLGELNYSTSLVYLDDIMIYLSTQEEHLQHLQAVLEWFQLMDWSLSPPSVSSSKGKIKYLSHWKEYGQVGLAIAKYPEPTTCTAIKGFVGLVVHYRCFIKDFAQIVDPLHEYAHGETAKKKKERVVLNEAARNAFHWLKKAVMSTQVLFVQTPTKNTCSKPMPWSSGWDPCFSKSNWTEGIILWPTEVSVKWSGGQLPKY